MNSVITRDSQLPEDFGKLPEDSREDSREHSRELPGNSIELPGNSREHCRELSEDSRELPGKRQVNTSRSPREIEDCNKLIGIVISNNEINKNYLPFLSEELIKEYNLLYLYRNDFDSDLMLEEFSKEAKDVKQKISDLELKKNQLTTKSQVKASAIAPKKLLVNENKIKKLDFVVETKKAKCDIKIREIESKYQKQKDYYQKEIDTIEANYIKEAEMLRLAYESKLNQLNNNKTNKIEYLQSQLQNCERTFNNDTKRYTDEIDFIEKKSQPSRDLIKKDIDDINTNTAHEPEIASIDLKIEEMKKQLEKINDKKKLSQPRTSYLILLRKVAEYIRENYNTISCNYSKSKLKQKPEPKPQPQPESQSPTKLINTTSKIYYEKKDGFEEKPFDDITEFRLALYRNLNRAIVMKEITPKNEESWDEDHEAFIEKYLQSLSPDEIYTLKDFGNYCNFNKQELPYTEKIEGNIRNRLKVYSHT